MRRTKDELKRWEEAILSLSKQYDRLEFMAGNQDDESQRYVISIHSPSLY
jgi:hypothetical protein